MSRPILMGLDNTGDLVWELPNGRWTWGDTPEAAMSHRRTFEPDRYVEKYGDPTYQPWISDLLQEWGHH